MAVPPDLPTVDETVALVRRWLTAADGVTPDAGARLLAGVLKDPVGLEFTLGFVDRVVRPEDPRAAATAFERLSRRVPRTLPWPLRALVLLGGGFSVLAPRVVIPIARRVLRRLVGHLVVDATPKRLDKAIGRLRASGARLDLKLLGDAAPGARAAAARVQDIRELLARDDVDHVSLSVPSAVAQLALWGFDETVERAAELLRPLYLDAIRSKQRKFITLETEAYRDLGLTIAVFTRLLDEPELRNLEAGIVLQAYLPDSVAALAHLTEWAHRRVDAGGAGIKVRIVKGAHLARERVDATLHGWPLATWPSKQATDTNYKRMLMAALTPDATAAVRVGVAGHNLFDLAWAWLLASGRGVEQELDAEMLLGIADAQALAVRGDIRRLLLLTPAVPPERFDAAVGYLARRLEEQAAPENFLSGLAELGDPEVFRRERDRFAESLAALDAEVPPANRTQNRLSAPLPRAPRHFRNEPDTDPALVANRLWALGILERSAASTLGADTLRASRVTDPARLDTLLRSAAEAGRHWAQVPTGTRAELLERAAEVLAVFRGRLIEVLTAEAGTPIADADAEASRAVDLALHHAELARELAEVAGAEFVPTALTVVTPSRIRPVSSAAAGVLASLAAGGAVVLKPAPGARRSAAVLAEALWEAGVPRELLHLVDLDDEGLERHLVTSPEVGLIALTGSRETAALFRSWRPELPLLAETRGVNAIVVTPSADLDLAVRDLVQSAFVDAGQSREGASLAILVGSVGASERFRGRLADAVSSLAVGYPQDPSTVVGPLAEPAEGAAARALTRLEEGESWLVKPRQLDATDRLWSPGVREGVAAGSVAHRTAASAPVLSLLRADTLEEAIALQNAVASGPAAGIQSLDVDEVAFWLDRVRAGTLAVNRPLTGAIVRRQALAGWGRSAVGGAVATDGPNALLVRGGWHPVAVAPEGDLRLDGLEPRVRELVEAFQPALDYAGFDAVRRGAYADAAAWRAEFGTARDVAQLGVERNVFRYRPAAATVRLAEGGSLPELVRVLAAAALARAPLEVSTATPLRMTRAASALGWGVRVESDAAFAARAARELPERVRLVGADAAALAAAVGGSPDVAVYGGPVTAAGRVELLPFLREQSVSITAHRFGAPDRALIALRV